MFEDLVAKLNVSYLAKVQQANSCYEDIKYYFIDEVGEEKAEEFLDTFVMQFLSSDGIVSNTEVAFYGDFAIKTVKQEALVKRYQELKAKGTIDEMRAVVDEAPEEIKRAVIQLAGWCLVCDKELTETEKDDYAKFIKIINREK